MHSLKPEVRDQMPDFAKFKPQEIVVKDYTYLNNPANNGFAWNNKQRIGPKFYPYYHKYNDQAKSQIEKNIQLEIEDKKTDERARIARLARDHKETFNQLHGRIQERTLLQIKSHQSLVNDSEPLTAEKIDRMTQPYLKTLSKKAIMAKHSVHNDNKWNFLLENDQKRSELLITPVSVKGEEELIQSFKKKLEEEQQIKQLEAQTYEEFRKNVRKAFKQRHQANLKLVNQNAPQSKEPGSDATKNSHRSSSQGDLPKGMEVMDFAYPHTYRTKPNTPESMISQPVTTRAMTPGGKNLRIMKLALPKKVR